MSLRDISKIGYRSIQWLKEQSSRGTLKPTQGRPRSDQADKPNQITRFSSTLEPMVKVDKGIGKEMISLRAAEKAENLMHIICWGPR